MDASYPIRRGPDGSFADWLLVRRGTRWALLSAAGPFSSYRVERRASSYDVDSGLWSSKVRIGALALEVDSAMVDRIQSDAVPSTPLAPRELGDGVLSPRRCMHDGLWAELRHPVLPMLVCRVAEAILGPVIALRRVSDRRAGLSPEHRHDPELSTNGFARSFAFAARVFDLPVPRLFLRANLAGGVLTPPVWPFASVAGRSVLHEIDPGEQLVFAGWHVARYHPAYLLSAWLTSTLEIQATLLASLRMIGRVDALEPRLEELAEALSRLLAPEARAALREAWARIDVDMPPPELIHALGVLAERWLRGVELTRCRAAALLANDFEAAQRGLRRLPTPHRREAVEDLQVFFGGATHRAILRELTGG